MLDSEIALEAMRTAGLEPIDPFPGVDAPWRSVHQPCGREVSPRYTNIKRGQGGCTTCALALASIRNRMPAEEAIAVFEAAGLTPTEPYPGSNRPWRAQHAACGRITSPTLSNVRNGRGICRYCNSSFPYAGPADLYLVTDAHAHKIGIAGKDSERVATHVARGWTHTWSIALPTGDLAYNLEQAVISWWRNDLGYPAAYTAADMPQYGATETVAAGSVTAGETLAHVLRLLEAQGVEDPDVVIAAHEALSTA
jgi:hypothetical protein